MWESKIQIFRTNFVNKKERLIIYGTGKIASALLPNIRDYNIVGVLDREKTSGSWNGIPYVDPDQIEKYGADTVVIVAAQRNVPVIYRRIAKLCKANQIKVRDIAGWDLSEIYDLYEADIPYFQKNWRDLHDAAERHAIISFDIFDTLLIRDSLYPKTVFDIMEEQMQGMGIKLHSFSELRMAAAANLSGKKSAPNIYEIYDEIQCMSSITDREKKYLINYEIELEKKLIRPRNSMLKFFNEIKKKRPIYLLSNMHLTKDIIEEILHNCGYTGYEELFVSCEYGKGKQNGLFDLLIKKAGVASARILHIGDSPNMDDIEPRKAGIHTFPIMSMVDMASNSSYAVLLEHDGTTLNQLILGRFLREAFDDPFILYGTKGRLQVNHLDVYVNLFLSPLAFLYTLWILLEAKRVQADYILYTARDGYLLRKIADIIRSFFSMQHFPAGSYFYASRRTTSLAALCGEEDARELASRSFHGSVEEMFCVRFGIQMEEKMSHAQISGKELEGYVKKYQREILWNAGEQRKNYEAYIRKCNIEQKQCIAVVDQCGFGNVQRGLAKIMSEKNLYGLFLKKNPGIISDSESSSFFPQEDSRELYGGSLSASLILEQFLSSPEPSLTAFDTEGNPLFGEELRSEGQIENLQYMHGCALEYCQGMCRYLEYIADQNPDWKLVNRILSLLDAKYTDICVQELRSMIVEDYFGAASSVKVE